MISSPAAKAPRARVRQRPWPWRWLPAVALLLFYWVVSLRGLAVMPPVYEDEAWVASTGWKWAAEGVFGSDLFAGYHGMERHFYHYLPLDSLLLAGVFRLAGLGLFQARFESVTLGIVAVALTYALGRRLFGRAVGGLSAAWLLLARTAGATRYLVTGIVFLDVVRIARYDMAVPVFGLAALHAWLTARRAGAHRPRWLVLAGLLAGLAGLGHLYGVFWLAMLAVLLLWDRAGWRSLLALAAGFALPWLPYTAYALTGGGDWLGQVRIHAPRFELLSPAWYAANLAAEAQRYGPGLGAPGAGWLLRPGFWAALALWPAALVVLLVRGWRGDWRARAVAVPLAVLQVLFAALLQVKLANYLVAILPLAAVAVAWLALRLWQAVRGTPAAWLRLALVVLGVAVGVEGVWRVGVRQAAARTATPYDAFIASVRAHVPAGARVLGLHNYWLGLHDRPYRSWWVPLLLAETDNVGGPVPLAASLSAVDPDVILLDDRMRAHLAEHDAATAEIRAWMAANGFTLSAAVDDTTYGRMEIYRPQP